MKASRIAGKVWLLCSYLLLTGALLWSAKQPAGKLSGGVFFVSLLLSWVPAYVYANWEDIRRNKVYWISQTMAIISALLTGAVLLWIFQAPDEPAVASPKDTFWTIAGAAAVYVGVQRFAGTLVCNVFLWVESFCERKLGK